MIWTPELLIGAGYVGGGGGVGAYDPAIDLRLVKGSYVVYESKEAYDAAGRGRNGVPSTRNVDFNWYPRRAERQAEEARTGVYVRVFDKDKQEMLRAAHSRYFDARELSADEFREMIDKFVLQYLTGDHLRRMLEAEYENGHEDGVRDKQREIQKVLGIWR